MGKADRHQLGILISTRMVCIPETGGMPHSQVEPLGTVRGQGMWIPLLTNSVEFFSIYWGKFVKTCQMFTRHGHYE